MKKLILVVAAFAFAGSIGPASAQDSNPAIKDGSPAHVTHAAEGANSFTEDQAKGRFAKAGYTGVSELMKNDKGLWVGVATKNGKKVHVALDYKGNVTQTHNKK